MKTKEKPSFVANDISIVTWNVLSPNEVDAVRHKLDYQEDYERDYPFK